MSATLYYVLTGAFLIVVLSIIIWSLVSTLLRYRGSMLITCPETQEKEAVEVDAMDAARWAALGGTPELRLRDCTRWPERENCGQECLRQIEESPESCLVRNILASWYEGKSCVFCSRPFGEINWHDHKPALMGADRVTLEWDQIHPETLPRFLDSALPVCWSCHIAETFRREHGDLVVDRRPPEQRHVSL